MAEPQPGCGSWGPTKALLHVCSERRYLQELGMPFCSVGTCKDRTRAYVTRCGGARLTGGILTCCLVLEELEGEPGWALIPHDWRWRGGSRCPLG